MLLTTTSTNATPTALTEGHTTIGIPLQKAYLGQQQVYRCQYFPNIVLSSESSPPISRPRSQCSRHAAVNKLFPTDTTYSVALTTAATSTEVYKR